MEFPELLKYAERGIRARYGAPVRGRHVAAARYTIGVACALVGSLSDREQPYLLVDLDHFLRLTSNPRHVCA